MVNMLQGDDVMVLKAPARSHPTHTAPLLACLSSSEREKREMKTLPSPSQCAFANASFQVWGGDERRGKGNRQRFLSTSWTMRCPRRPSLEDKSSGFGGIVCFERINISSRSSVVDDGNVLGFSSTQDGKRSLSSCGHSSTYAPPPPSSLSLPVETSLARRT